MLFIRSVGFVSDSLVSAIGDNLHLYRMSRHEYMCSSCAAGDGLIFSMNSIILYKIGKIIENADL